MYISHCRAISTALRIALYGSPKFVDTTTSKDKQMLLYMYYMYMFIYLYHNFIIYILFPLYGSLWFSESQRQAAGLKDFLQAAIHCRRRGAWAPRRVRARVLTPSLSLLVVLAGGAAVRGSGTKSIP